MTEPEGPPKPRGAAALRVAIVDDHPMFRMGLAVAIAEMADIDVVGEAQTADEVADLVSAADPDVLLLDVRLGDSSGLEVNRWLAAQHPAIKVIMLTMSEDHDTALTALSDGAAGYLVKGTDPERLEHALRAAAAGDVVLDHDMAQAVTELAMTRRRAASNRPFAELTEREFHILDLVAQGLDNQAIARRLVLSPKTVRNHVSNVLTKLHVADRSQAIVLGRERGLGQGSTRPTAG
ncbi:MAG TPA: response regulator transcription factor [Acidimicrobiales bacterium]|nr:response regulator transcription factor [Acidimicrobiales bacterium]